MVFNIPNLRNGTVYSKVFQHFCYSNLYIMLPAFIVIVKIQ